MSQGDRARTSERRSWFGLKLLDSLTRRHSIRRILLVILLMSLVPLLALSTWQGVSRLHRDRQTQQQQLLDAVRLTSTAQLQVFAHAQSILKVLSAAPVVRGREAATCSPLLKAAVGSQLAYRNFTVSAADGRIACASDPGAIGVPATTDPQLWQQLQRGEFLITAPVWGTVSRSMVLRAMQPLTTASGKFDGVITASIDQAWLQRELATQHRNPAVAVALIDSGGYVLASSRPMPARRFDDSPSGIVSDVTGPDGTNWSYAAMPLELGTHGGEQLRVVYASAYPVRFGSEWWSVAFFFALPLLALALASIGIWVGANRAILNWVSQLGALAQQIGQNNRPDMDHRSGFADAPSEVRDLAAELLRMRGTIADREQRLHGAAAAQTSVALELHHRVRNNLQVISSFLSLQAQEIVTGDARDAIDEARLRVAAMAMVNGLLYDQAEVTTVETAQLLHPIAEVLHRHTEVEAIVDLHPEATPRIFNVDRATPLVLWIIEAALCLCERADPAVRPSKFRISMTPEPEVLCITLTMHGLLPDSARPSLHRRLVMAIARQQGGTARIEDVGITAGKIVLCLPNDTLASHPKQPVVQMADV